MKQAECDRSIDIDVKKCFNPPRVLIRYIHKHFIRI